MREHYRGFENSVEAAAFKRISAKAGDPKGYISPVQNLTNWYEAKLQRRRAKLDKRHQKQQKLKQDGYPGP